MHLGAALPQRVAWVAAPERKALGLHQLQPNSRAARALPPRQKYPPLHLELKTAFPHEDFPLNNNILMVTILKVNLEVTTTNLTDSYNISLSTADCLRNLSSDLNRYYLPALA